MLSRLYMLFPKPEQAHDAVGILKDHGVPVQRMHTIAHDGIDISELPEANEWQRSDFAEWIEHKLWNLNLVLFGIMLFMMVVALYEGNWGWAIFAAVMSTGSVYGGYYFATHVARAHMDECRAAIRHGEVLLLVDVPRYRIHAVETSLKNRHPEAELGGIGWTMESLPI